MNGWQWALFLGMGALLALYVAGYLVVYRTCVQLMRHYVRLARAAGLGESPIRIHFRGLGGFDLLNLRWILRVAVMAEFPGRRVHVRRNGQVLEAWVGQ